MMSHSDDCPSLTSVRGLPLRPMAPRSPEEVLAERLEKITALCDATAARFRLIDADSQTLCDCACHSIEDGPRIDLQEAEEAQIRAEVIEGQRVWRSSPGREPSILAIPIVEESQPVAVIEIWGMGKESVGLSDEVIAKIGLSALTEARLNRELLLRHREIDAFHDIQFLITGDRELREVLEKIVRTTSETLGGLECTIRLAETADDGTPHMRVAAWAGRPITESNVWPLLPGSIDAMVMSGETVAIENLLTDPRVRDPNAARKRGLASLLTTPMRAGGRIIGALRLFLGVTHVFDEEEIELLKSIAGQAAIAIENTRLYHRAKDAHEQLQKSYEELRTTQKELVKSEKLAALGEMSALVAHEIRNPLTAVRGFAQRVQRKVADQERLAQSCQIIIDEVDRLNKVIVDVLDFARRLEPQMGDHSLNLLVQDVLNLEAETLKKRGIAIVTDCAPSLPPVHMDPGQIRQVILNLIANARAAMGEKGGGTLTLRTRRHSGGIQSLDIIDTGPGIPPEVQERIFTPFFTTKTHGTGLGLAVGRRIADDHSGELSLVSAKDEGATFTLTLPESKE